MKRYYAGADVHKSTISFYVLDEKGVFYRKRTIATTKTSILKFIKGLKGRVVISIEEGPLAHWFYTTFKEYVEDIIVTDPRKNRNGTHGDKSDELDAQYQAEDLFFGRYKPIFHDFGEYGDLRELTKSYTKMTTDIARTKNRIKSLYASHGVACGGRSIYGQAERSKWLSRMPKGGARSRAEMLFAQLDAIGGIQRTCLIRMVKEAKKHGMFTKLQTVPGLGPIRTTQLLSHIVTPYRFKTKYHLYKYCGFKVVSRGTGQMMVDDEGGIVKNRKKNKTYGLNKHCNRTLKKVFKEAAVNAVSRPEFASYEEAYIAKGGDPDIARVRTARKLAAITYTIWKRGDNYDPIKAFPYQSETDD